MNVPDVRLYLGRAHVDLQAAESNIRRGSDVGRRQTICRSRRALSTESRWDVNVGNSRSAQLTEVEQRALSEFVTRLRDRLNGSLFSVTLFGSRARGDYSPDSDYDVLIVLDNGDSQIRDDVRLLAARVSLEHDVLIKPTCSAASGGRDWPAKRPPIGATCKPKEFLCGKRVEL